MQRYSLVVWLSELVFVVLATWHFSLPGLQYDECLAAAPAVTFLNLHAKAEPMQINPSVIHILGRPFPLMIMPYVGPVKIVLHVLIYSLVGISVLSTRLAPLLCVMLALPFAHKLILRRSDKATSEIFVLLLAVHPVIVFYLTRDVGPYALAFLLHVVSLYFFDKWFSGGNDRYFYAAMLLWGLGISHKLDFAWIIIGWVSVWLLYRHDLRPIGFRVLSVGVICFLAGAAPQITLLIAAPNSIRGVYGTRLSIWSRFGQLLNMLSGDWIPFYFAGLHSLFMIASLALALLAFVIAKKDRAVLLWCAIFFALSCFSFNIAAHQLIIIVPAILYVLARKKILSIILIVVFLLISLETNIKLEKTGGVGVWSDAIYEVADDLKKENKPVILADWGFTNNLIVLLKGDLELKRLYVDKTLKIEPGDLILSRGITQCDSLRKVYRNRRGDPIYALYASSLNH